MMGNDQGNSSSCRGDSIPNTTAPATVTSNPWPISVSEPPHSFPDHHLYPTSTQNMEAREEDDEEEEEEDVQEEKTEVFYMEDDETEEIDTLNEDLEQDDAEDEEVNEEDVEEETILTGKFKNIRGYQERVRRLSDDTEDRPPPVSVIVYDDTHLTETKEDNKEEEIEEVVNESVSGTELASQLSELQVEDVGIQVDAEDADGSGEDAGTRSSSEETDPERIEDFKMRIKRSSSLKCGKTPPGTPGRKKIVRFADMLGLDLAAVRTFLGGGVPHVPRSAFWDLQVEKQASNASARVPTMDYLPNVPRRVLTPLFQQPGCQLNFLERVRNQRVVVESVDVGDDMSVRGIVRVLNLDYHKNVCVRYTFDQWRNFHEATAIYIPGSYDGLTDRFSFLLWGSFLQDNGALVFCVRYHTLGQEFWDNNYGRNYSLQCYTTSGLPGEKGPDGSTRPQNSSSVQQHFGSDHHGSSTDSRHHHHHHQHNYHSFSSGSPTTPNDPWTTRFF